MSTPAQDLLAFLATTFPAKVTVGSNGFADVGEHFHGDGVPKRAVFCTTSGGPKPVAILGTPKYNAYRHTVQVLVRCDVDKPDEGIDDTVAYMTACQRATIAGYHGVELLQSSPNRLPEDALRCPRWSYNVLMSQKRA